MADLQLEQSLGRSPAPAPAPASTEAGSKTSKHKLKQMKSSANKKMSSLKSQITDIYRYVKIVHTSLQRVFFRNTFSSKDAKATKDCPSRHAAEVSSCPGGDTGRVSGALRSIETVGSRIRSSRSLQSLESATADSFRSVRERTGEVILASDWLST